MIQYLFRRLCFVLSIALVVSASDIQALDIVKDGKPFATIVVAEDTTQYQKWAAQWLQEYIEKATGAKLEIVSESKAPAGGVLISVGHTELAKKANIKTDDLKYDGCRLQVKDNVLYLIGRDYVPPKDAKLDGSPKPNSGRPQGTIRAVTTFLEDIAGVRWYLPGPEGIFIPNTRELSVPDTCDKTFSPLIAYASTGYDLPIARYANNDRYAINVKLFGGHSWGYHVSAKEDAGNEMLEHKGETNYFKEHPEYFRMDETGKRNPSGGYLCTSNPDVRKIMVEKMRKTFDEGYDLIELGANDGWRPCLCPECQKAYGDGNLPVSADRPAERVWEMHKWIFDELAKSHPDKKVMPTIYDATVFPSKKFDRLPDNVVAEFCSKQPDDEIWRGKLKVCTVYDCYVWEEDCVPTCFVPAIDPEWLQKRMRRYRECGVIGLCGGGRGVSWGLGGPTFYAYAKLAGDPDVNIDKLLTEYCQGVYGESGRIMERFFKLFHRRSGKSLEESSFCADRLQFANSYPAEDAFCALYPPAIVSQLDWLLKKAEGAAKSERAKGWLKHTRDEFDGLKTIAEMFAAKRAFELQPTREMLLLVKDKVNTFEDWRTRILSYSKDPDYIKRWFPHYYYLCNDLTSEGSHAKWEYNYYHSDQVIKEVDLIVKGAKSVRGKGIGSMEHNGITAPITWDFEKMQAGLGRTREEKQFHVQRATIKPGADGALDPAAWANTTALPFEVYKGANSRLDENTATTVRLLYDDKRLYVRYECREPNIDNLKLKSVGRDGDVYHQDEVELFLNPECSNRKMMHFMAAPVKDAMYDERKGYIEDLLNPRYSDADVAWNVEWTYTYTIEQENKRWILEMAVPFKSFGVKPPQEGNVWTANFARARRAGDFQELSCWIAEDFGNPEVFGELVFGDEAEKSPGGTRPEGSSNTTTQGATQFMDPGRSGESEMIKNGGFEQVGDDGKPMSWRIDSYPESKFQPMVACCSVTTEQAHGGERSLKIDFLNIDVDATWKASQIVFNQRIGAETMKRLLGKQVVLSAWLKYDYLDDECKGPKWFPGPCFHVRVWGQLGPVTNTAPAIVINHTTLPLYGVIGAKQAGKWVRVEQRGQIPQETESMDILCELLAWDRFWKKANATSVYIDDIRLEAVNH